MDCFILELGGDGCGLGGWANHICEAFRPWRVFLNLRGGDSLLSQVVQFYA